MLGTPARRIALAVALSLLVHVLLLWLPHTSVPHDEKLPPPLMAKLEPLPKLAVQPRRKPAPKPTPATRPQPVAEPVKSGPAPVIDAASAVEAVPAIAAASAVDAEPAAAIPEEAQAAHPLPRHARLTFHVYKGAGGLKIGTVTQELDINGDEYILKALTRTTGLATMVKDYRLTQISRGKAEPHGLAPESFEEEVNNDGKKESVKATFDRPSQKVLFSHGGSAGLPVGAQDMLSIFYNLSQLPLNGDTIQLIVCNGKKLEKYEFKIEPEEEVRSYLGMLKALHLRKLHAKGESGFEIWLGLEYRLLPIKYRLIEPSGEVSGDILISDIRVADE